MAESKTKILIVEDDPIISHDIELILNKEGYEVVGRAYNATKAIDILASGTIDFVLLDIHLGRGENGIHVAGKINSQYKIPYIFLTSFSDKETLSAAMEHGPYGYLVKPFQEATLLSTVALALNNFRLQSNKPQFKTDGVELTDQEQKICKGLFDGKSYQAIADEHFISINTVRYHVKNMYLKFDVKGRAELVNKLLS